MYSSISKHDNINYGRKLSNLRNSTLDYPSSTVFLTSPLSASTNSKLPIIVGAAIVVLAGGGAFAYYKLVHKKKKTMPQQQRVQQQRAQQQRAQQQRAQQQRAQQQRAQQQQQRGKRQIKPKSKSKWIWPAIGIVAICGGGGAWILMKRASMAKSIS